MSELLKELRNLTKIMEKYEQRRTDLVTRIKGASPVGRFNGFTVYEVKPTKVKAHMRGGFRAVRVWN